MRRGSEGGGKRNGIKGVDNDQDTFICIAVPQNEHQYSIL